MTVAASMYILNHGKICHEPTDFVYMRLPVDLKFSLSYGLYSERLKTLTEGLIWKGTATV